MKSIMLYAAMLFLPLIAASEEPVLSESQNKIINEKNTTVSQCVYHPELKNNVFETNKDGIRTKFFYNEQCDLFRVVNSKGQLITLIYNSDNTIEHMIEIDTAESSVHELYFKYNANRKPTEIRMLGVGEITVEYDEKGEISKVKSEEGAKMALKVMMAFQNLLRMTSMAPSK